MKIRLCSALFLMVATVANAQIPATERDALIALYNSTDGANWLDNTNWLGTVGTECDWFGVICGGGSVQSLDLDANHLTGTLPPDLGSLSGLEGLFLDSNQLAGNIPSALQHLSNLKWMYLQFNQLTGNIPSELGNLSSLEGLWLNDNQLDGSIPSELEHLSNLVVMVLGNNQLSGSIPPELGNLPSLVGLFLDSNHFSGSIPPELGSLENLTSLALNFNELTGLIPPQLGNLVSLQKLYLHYNHLEGGIPLELGGLSALTGLFLHNNQLSGCIPPELGGLSSLTQLYLGSNQLGGCVPTEMEFLSNLTFADLSYNAFWTDDAALQVFLESKDPDWDETQTVSPEGLTVQSVSDQTVWLEWTPIGYSGDSGGYEVFFDDLGGGVVSAGRTSDKTITTFPVTNLLPNHAYELTVGTVTLPHSLNQNVVVSERSEPVMATTGNSGDTAPVVTVDHDSDSSILTAEDGHDGYEWSTGETSMSIVVSPSDLTFYWVRATGPGDYDEAAVVLVGTLIFFDGFEDGDVSGWSNALP